MLCVVVLPLWRHVSINKSRVALEVSAALCGVMQLWERRGIAARPRNTLVWGLRRCEEAPFDLGLRKEEKCYGVMCKEAGRGTGCYGS